jgi:EmrB/QacA subfamily drug resistance transporter
MEVDVEGHPRRWLIVAVMALCMFVATMDNTIMTVALAQIQQDLGASNAQLQWSMDAYTLTFAAFLFTTGLLGDRYGRGRVLMAGLAFFALTSVFGALSASPGQLIVWRGLMGVGAAVVPGCTMAVITTVFPVAERARAIALWSVSAGLAIAAGPIIGGALLGAFWWGSALLVNVPFALAAAVLIALLVPAGRDPAPGRLDIAGVLLSIAGIGALVYGIIKGGEGTDWLTADVLGPIVVGVVLLAVLLVVEARLTEPSLDLALFRERSFAAGSAVLHATFFAAMGVSYVIVFYLQVLRGHSPLEAGLLMLPLAVGSMAAAGRADGLSARLGGPGVVTTGAVVMAVAFACYAMMGAGTSLWLFCGVQFLTGFGFGLTFAAAMAVTLSRVVPAKAGAGSAVANTLRHMGTALGIAVLGSVLGTVYRDGLGDLADRFPPAVRDEAATSLGGTLRAVAADRSLIPTFVPRAESSFLHAMHAAMWVSGGVSLLAAVISLLWLRHVSVPSPEPAPKETVAR